MKFLDNPNIAPAVREIIRSSENVALAVAFWGRDAGKSLLGDINSTRKNSVRLLCDLEMGGTNPWEIDQLLSEQYLLSHFPYLHAKVYLGDNRVVVGSANASANGIGLEGEQCDGLQEAALYSEDSNVVASAWTWFEDLWDRSTLISDDPDALERARSRWAVANRQRPLPSSETSLLRAILDRPEELEGRLWFAIYPTATGRSDLAEAGIDALKEAHRDWKELAYYWGWPELERLPANARVVDLRYSKNGRLYAQKAQYEILDLPLGNAEEGAHYCVVKRIRRPGLALSEDDRDVLSDSTLSEAIWSLAYPDSRFPYDADAERGGVLSVQDMHQLLKAYSTR